MFDHAQPGGDEDGQPAGAGGVDDATVAAVDAASSLLGTLAALPAGVLDEDVLADGVLALEQARRLLDGAELAWLGELDRRGTTDVRFGQRPAAWLAHEAKLPRPVASARVRTARKLATELEPVGDALRRGEIGVDHARVLADAANPRNLAGLAGLADELCDAARLSTFQRWSQEVRGLADELDADGGHDPSRDLPEPRLSVNRVGDVTTVGGQLAGDGAQVVDAALNQVADELFRRHTRDVALTGEKVPRRPHLLAEALVELCRRGLAVEPGSARPPRCEATVVVNAAEPERVTDPSGVRLDAVDVLLCDPVLRPVVTAFDGRPLAVGRDQRLAAPHQVRAVALRDGGCVFPGCESPSAWNDTHHVDPWGGGGDTDVDRMCGLCRHHHRVAHRPGWHLELDPDGWTRWTRPDGTTYWGQRHHRQRAGPPPTG